MTKPNIVFMLIDDMGWRDLGCYGSEFYESPNIDKLCEEGMKFTDAYAACPVCSPTRASLMSGKYPARVGVTNYIDWGRKHHPLKGRVIDAPYTYNLPLSEHSLASALKDEGYATWHIGKWHLGDDFSYPEKHGFDVNVGGCEWGMPINGYFAPWGLPVIDDSEIPEGTYLDDYLTDKAIDLIKNADGPFFLNMWFYAVHCPIHAKDEDIEYFRERAKRMGLDEKPFVDDEPYQYEKNYGRRIRRRTQQSSPEYAAMILNLDRNIGKLLDALKKKGVEDETVVMFTSDNGGLSTGGAPTCNFPLSKGKCWMEEGGTREPYIVRYPGIVKAGSVCDEPITSPDLYPTLLELAGVDLVPEQHVDGKSFAPLLRGEEMERGPVFWHYPHYGNAGGHPGSSVRLGDYKLIHFLDYDVLRLFNLKEDVGEERDLSDELPEKRDELFTLLKNWREDVGALLPQPNPDWEERFAEGCSPTV